MLRAGALATLCLLGACLFKPDKPGGTTNDPDSEGRLAAGAHHACAIEVDATLWCWGDNRSGQLGMPATTPYTGVPHQIEGAWSRVAAGRAHTCAIDAADRLFCWGANGLGQAGTDAAISVDKVEVRWPGTGSNVPAFVYAGGDATCVLTRDAKLWCFGNYVAPENAAHGLTLIEIPNAHPTWFEVAMSATHVCVMNDFRKAFCWGNSNRGGLGTSDGLDRTPETAYEIPDLAAETVGAGNYGSCAVSAAGELVCWGHSTFTGAGADSPPIVLGSDHDWGRLAVGAHHVCGTRGGELYCYGQNDRGQLGNRYHDQITPGPSSVQTGVVRVVAGSDFTCTRDTAGDVRCWGSNQFGETGNGKVTSAHAPVAVLQSAVRVATGDRHTCAARTTGEVECWGDNRDHQVSTSAQPFATMPTAAGPSVTSPTSIKRLLSLGKAHSCALTDNYGLVCWGANGSKQLGLTPGTPISAADLGTSSEWEEVDAGGDATCALTSSGNVVYCWGTQGTSAGDPRALTTPSAYDTLALGEGTIVGARDPGPVGTGTQAVEQWGGGTQFPCFSPMVDTSQIAVGDEAGHIARVVHVGARHACATDNDRNITTKLYCWGDNHAHQVSSAASACVANPATLSSTAIVALPGSAHVKNTNSSAYPATVATGGDHTCAISETAEQIYCWGDNSDSSLGIKNDLADVVVSPKLAVDLPAAATWREIATGPHHTCAVSTDDQVYCWGLNAFGEIGNGDRFPDFPPPDPVMMQ